MNLPPSPAHASYGYAACIYRLLAEIATGEGGLSHFALSGQNKVNETPYQKGLRTSFPLNLKG